MTIHEDVAVVGFAQSPVRRHGEGTTSGVEMLVPIFAEVFRATGLAKGDVGHGLGVLYRWWA